MATNLILYDGAVGDTQNFGSSTVGFLQSFLFSAPALVTGFRMKGSRGISWAGGTMTVKIRQDTYNGTVLYSETFNTSILPAYTASPTMQTIAFTTPTFIPDSSKTYFLEIKVVTGNINDEARWSADIASPTYANVS